MNKKFEVGKRYECANINLGYIEILKRTNNNITVFDGKEEWSGRARIDKDGYEYIQKTDVPLKIKGLYTYSSEWEAK